MQAGGTGKVNVTAGGDVSFVQSEAFTLGNGSANTAFVRTTGANDISLRGQFTASGAGNSLTLVSGKDFNNYQGTNALQATNGRWLVYSADPLDNIEGGLQPQFRKFDADYAGNLPAGLTEVGKGFVYVTDQIPAKFQKKRSLPSTVAQVSQLPRLQLAPVRSPRTTVDGEVFEIAEPLRLQIEAGLVQGRSASSVGTVSIDPRLKRSLLNITDFQ